MNEVRARMDDPYIVDGERRALAMSNRGPLTIDDTGRPSLEILDGYWRDGFYVFESALSDTERDELVADFERLLDEAPLGRDAQVDRKGCPAAGLGFAQPSFRFAKPLSDPHGGTDLAHGRYEAKMSEPTPPADAPNEVVLMVRGPLQLMEPCLRLYGHPGLLRVTEAINGPDFTPFAESVWVKQAGLGPSTAWHQDGTTHWDKPELDHGSHGFNFMVQLFDTTPQNALWVVPGTHDSGKIDIEKQVAQAGSDRLPGAVPMLMKAGDVVICNRQILHGSFANISTHQRVTFVFGFHRRSSVLGMEGWAEKPYDLDHVTTRSRIISLAVDARRQHFPAEDPYVYQPLAHEDIQYTNETQQTMLKNYNLNDIFL